MIHVLIVDDDPLVRAGLRFIFDSADDVECVGEATDGKESIVEVERVHPDVVLMDLRMPGMDGREATAELMKLPEPPKVLALTTFDTDAHVLSVLDAGASGYLLKDTPPAEIIDAVRETAEGRTILSSRHARVLLDKYSENGNNARKDQAIEALSQLTEREREVVQYVAQGLTNAEIGKRLHCSPATVKAHLASIFTQLQITNRVRLAVLGHDAGLSDSPT
ncbi:MULTISPECIES: response regulator transcription factor [Micrococcales]|uniref:Two component transcriptional regulator, LuxR family n=3 Tax=Brevibacterium TaxID=1696 RepID=A0A2H1KC10_BRELN|nr:MULTISPECIES: response regulator transcription factor [Brevibacterium]KAB1943100.1 response regulator transcription factor [Brevibacterium linens ATCC 9172]SMX92431.1 two component transcriptional regulator, LuxR family [Brevibacterium antiquum]SMX97337.1 two component transcriptional regulator, LuxR family [Brevibacterium linens]SMY01365.1 two component transcriptional regulator, LuxR family [Brevibacterium linens ATCC 9172]